MTALDTLTANNDPRTAAAVAAAQAKILDGSLKIFSGPLTNQAGQVAVPAGTVMTDDEVWNISWYVRGEIGRPE
jgi:basic membrane protein A